MWPSDGFLVGLHPPCVGYMIRRYEAEHVGDYFFSQVGQEGFSSSFYFFFLFCWDWMYKERAAEEVRPMYFHTSRWIRTNKYFFFFLFLFSSFHLESIETLHILLLCTAWIPSTTHFSPTFSTWLSHIQRPASYAVPTLPFCCCWSFDSSSPLCDAQIDWRGATYFYQSI